MSHSTPTPKRYSPSAIGRVIPARTAARSALAVAASACMLLLSASPGLATEVTGATGPAGPAGPTGPEGPPGANGSNVCLSRRVITVHWKIARYVETGKITVLVGGSVYRTLPATARKLTVKLTGTAGPETVTVEIRTRTLTGVTLANTRTYHVCVPTGSPHKAPDLYLTV
jgi:hypothetical protein